MRTWQAKPLSDKKYRLAEGPYWDPRFQRISWVDILEGCLYTQGPDGDTRRFSLGQPLGAAVPLKGSEGFLLAGRDGLYALEDGEARLVYDLRQEYGPGRRSNDAKADPKGRLWFGCMEMDEERFVGGNLYRYEKGGIRLMQKDTKISNGMAWSRDRRRFYFSDSLCHCVFVYDYDLESGSIRDRRVLFEVEGGVPDGLCIDSEDNLWLAVWGGRRVEKRSGATGEKLAEVEVPAEHVSSCCFMGKEYDTLLITSAGEGLSGEYDGRLFTCRVEARGLAPDLAVLG